MLPCPVVIVANLGVVFILIFNLSFTIPIYEGAIDI